MQKSAVTLFSSCLGVFMASALIASAQAADLEAMIKDCDACHGKDGVSEVPEIPTIAGNASFYIVDSMANYRDGARLCEDVEYPAGDKKGEVTTMCKVAEETTEEDDEMLAEHYEGLEYVRAKQEFDAGLAAKGEELHDKRCKKCHEDGGSSPDDEAGFLAGQWTPYLRSQFKAYSDETRPMPEKMVPKYEDLTDEEKEALLHYYASLQE